MARTEHDKTNTFWGRGYLFALTSLLALGLVVGVELLQPSTVQGGPSGNTRAGQSSPSQLAGYLPDDTLFLVEAPQLWSIGSSMRSFSYVNADKLGPFEFVNKIEQAIADAYGISAEDAERVVASLDSAAFAGRSPRLSGNGDDDIQAVGLVRFSDSSAGSLLIASDRFTKGEAIGSSGHFYSVEEDYELEGMASGLGRMNTSDAEDERFAWFPSVGVAAFGHADLITSIGSTIETGANTLSSDSAFQTASRDYNPNALLIGFVDTAELKKADSFGVYLEQVFGSSEPTSFSMHPTPFGFNTQMTCRMQGIFMPPEELMANKIELSLPSKLPASTLLYAGGSAQIELSGADYFELYLEYLSGIAEFLNAQVPEGAQFSVEKMIAMMAGNVIEEIKKSDNQLGFSMSDAYDAFGDEFYMAVIVEGELRNFFTSPERLMIDAAAVMLGDVGDAAALERVFDGLKGLLKKEMGIETQETDNGWTINLEMLGLPNIEAQYLMDKKYILLGFGASSVIDSVGDSLSGKGKTLGDDPAFTRAQQTVSTQAHAQMWFDTGRFIEAGFGDMSEKDKAMMEEEVGFSPDVFRMSGVDRPTTMVSISVDCDPSGIWTTHFEASNLFMAFGAVGAVVAILEPWGARLEQAPEPPTRAPREGNGR